MCILEQEHKAQNCLLNTLLPLHDFDMFKNIFVLAPRNPAHAPRYMFILEEFPLSWLTFTLLDNR